MQQVHVLQGRREGGEQGERLPKPGKFAKDWEQRQRLSSEPR